MWKNASGSQKRKRKRQKEIADEARNYKKLDYFAFGKRAVNGQYVNELLNVSQIC